MLGPRLRVGLLAALGWALAAPLGVALVDLAPALGRRAGALSFGAGAALGALTGAALLRWAPLLTTLEHELTHLVAALLLLRRPLSLRVGPEGGRLSYTGRGSSVILLAPYVLPTFTFLGLAAAPLVGRRFGAPYLALLGATWGFHLWTGAREAHPRQTDLLRGGLAPSYLAVVAWSAVLYPLAALWALGGAALVRRWGRLALAVARGWWP